MTYTGNIAADYLYDIDQNTKKMEKQKAYFCEHCTTYYDSSGMELNKFDAVDNYEIEDAICYDCHDCPDLQRELIEKTAEGLFEKLGSILKS